MEWIAGGTLRQRLREHPDGLPTAELRATARSLLGALRHLHAAGIAHGDLKPSNLLLRAPGEVVLADFGSAELTGGARGSTGAAGTPLYFAPEQFQGAPSSPATDVYAAGAILWEAVTGRPLRSHADLMRGVVAPDPFSTEDRARIEAHGPALLRLLVLLLGNVPALRNLLLGGVEVDL
jgi:serine/threonine protein kinase